MDADGVVCFGKNGPIASRVPPVPAAVPIVGRQLSRIYSTSGARRAKFIQ